MFNEGLRGIGKIMDACPVSNFTKMDAQNIRDAERQASSAVKKIRKKGEQREKASRTKR